MPQPEPRSRRSPWWGCGSHSRLTTAVTENGRVWLEVTVRRASKRRVREWILVALVGLVATGASDASEPLPDPLDLRSALEAARTRNPDIRAAQARYLAMRERPIQEATNRARPGAAPTRP